MKLSNPWGNNPDGDFEFRIDGGEVEMRRSPTSEEAHCPLKRMTKRFNLSEDVDTGAGVLAFIGQKTELWQGRLPVDDVFFVVSSLNKISSCCHYYVDLLVRQVC